VYRAILGFFLLALSLPVNAGSELLYKDIPSWVEQADFQTILAENPDSDNFFVILDKQIKIEDGEEHSYSDIAMRVQSIDFLSQVGRLLQGAWQPDRQDLIIHRLDLFRDGTKINVLESGAEFQIIRQEKGLNNQHLNGVLTATIQIEDLRIGDHVRFSFSKKARNPALEGRAETAATLVSRQIQMDFDRIRYLWPTDQPQKYKIFGEGAEPSVAENGKYATLTLGVKLPEQTKKPKSAPGRFKIASSIRTSGFSDWKEVSKVAEKQYRTDGLIGPESDLAAEVQKIRAASDDPMQRAAMSLRLVQDKVRYLYNGLGYGNYEPQTPGDTWRLKYGDCKAKTLLLLAILDELEVEAEPVLVNLNNGDAVSKMLPSFQAFNHIMVRAFIDGKTLWLDGTGAGDRMEDLLDAPPHRFGLPVNKKGADLVPITIGKPGRPYQETNVRYDQTAGLAFPAFFQVKLKLRGQEAKNLQVSNAQYSESVFNKALFKTVEDYVVGAVVVDAAFEFDDESHQAYVNATGLSYIDWARIDGQSQHKAWSVVDNIELKQQRKRPEWREIPVDLGASSFYRENADYILPNKGNGFILKGDEKASQIAAGRQVDRTTFIEDGVVKISEQYYLVEQEVAAANIRTEARKLKRLARIRPKIIAPVDHPETWEEVLNAKKQGTLDKYYQAFATLIANSEEDEDVHYRRRANFYEQIGEYEKAADDLALAAEIKPTASTLSWRATMLSANDTGAAIEILNKALSLEPTHSGTLNLLVDLHNFSGKHEKATNVVDEAYKNGLDDDEADILRANILLASGKANQAIAELELLLDDKPNDAYLLGLRCWYKGLGNVQLESAIADCTKAIRLSKNPSTTLDSRGLVYMRLGQFDKAVEDFTAALDISPEFAESLYQRSIAYHRLGKAEQSKRDLTAAITFNKNVAREFNHYKIKH